MELALILAIPAIAVCYSIVNRDISVLLGLLLVGGVNAVFWSVAWLTFL